MNTDADDDDQEKIILRNIIENLPIVLFAKNVEQNYSYAMINREAEEFFGYSKQELLGKNDFDFFKEEEASFFRRTDENVMAGGRVVDIPCEQVTTVKGPMLAHTRKVPIFDKSGKPVMLLGILQDITQQKYSELELRHHREHLENMVTERTEKLKDAMSKAEEVSRLKSEFLATMSHEIRTPMNAILGMAELIMGAAPSPQVERYARIIINSGETLLNIINDILDFSKIEAGRMDLEIAPVDMLQLVDDLGALYSVKARDKAIELVVRYLPGTEQFVYADSVRIRQILGNLIDNAIKFTDKGHVCLTVSAQPPGDTVSGPDDVSMIFTVSDTGIGLSPQNQARIFERFSQADNSTTRRYGGTGLGLSICQSLVTLMDGSLSVKSSEGAGASFYVHLPLTRNRQEYREAAAPASLKGKRVLIVDDLPVVRDMVCEQLNNAGLRAAQAATGPEALAMMHAGVAENDPFHIAVIDYLMPGMNGEALAQAISGQPALQEICLVMLTAAGNPAANEDFTCKSFCACLAKPVQSRTLPAALAQAWEYFCSGQKAAAIVLDGGFAPTHREPTEPIAPGKRILVAEDNLVNQFFIREILSEMQCECVLVSNGQEAIEALEVGRFDLVILDCLMPVMDGFEAAQRVNAMKIAGALSVDLPVLALTANAMKGDREKCIQAGMDEYVAKPVRKRELKQTVRRLLGPGVINAPPTVLAEIVSLETMRPDKQAVVIDITAVRNARSILKGRYSEMIDLFLQSMDERWDEMRQSSVSGDTALFIRAAHTLKSICQQMGAQQLSQLARNIEYSVKRAEPVDWAAVLVLMERIPAVMKQTREAFLENIRRETAG